MESLALFEVLFLLCFLKFFHFLLSCIELVNSTSFEDSLFSCVLWVTVRTYFHSYCVFFYCWLCCILCSTRTYNFYILRCRVYSCFHNVLFYLPAQYGTKKYKFLLRRALASQKESYIEHSQDAIDLTLFLEMVPRARLELARVKHWFLRPACLPIPPPGHIDYSVFIWNIENSKFRVKNGGQWGIYPKGINFSSQSHMYNFGGQWGIRTPEG